MSVVGTPTIKQEPWERPEVAVLIPATMERIRAEGMNVVEKAHRAYRLLDQLVSPFRDKQNMFFRHNGETDEEYEARRVAHNNQVWADHSVLSALDKGCNLSPERADRCHASVLKDMPRLQEYSTAYELVKTIEEENLDLEKPSRTAEILKERLDEQEQGMSDYLGFALTAEQNALLNRLHSPGGRYKEPRFRLMRLVRNRTVLGIPIRIGPVSYRVSFATILRHCLTQADVRAALTCWRVECRAERRDGVTVLLTEHHEIWPT